MKSTKVQNPRRRGIAQEPHTSMMLGTMPIPITKYYQKYPYAVCHIHACATSAQLFQRLLWFLYVVCHVHACATSAQFLQRLLWFLYAVYHFFAGLKFGRMFQLPLCSVYVVCLALFSQISLVQSLRFIASFLAIHCALLFDGKVCPHTQTARLACTVVSHCGHTFFGRLSLSIGQPPLHTTHRMYEY